MPDRPPSPAPSWRPTEELPFARSPQECQLYLRLQPCRCGTTGWRWSRHFRQDRPDAAVSVYQGTCPGCGTEREAAFVLATLPAPAFGGPEPSQLLDPAQYLDECRRAAAVPEDPASLAVDGQARAAASLGWAVAALEEVLKFIPPGALAVPPEAFTSDTGWATYAADPDEFRADRLTALRRRLRQTLAGYERALAR